MSIRLEQIMSYASEAQKKHPQIDLSVVRSEFFFGQEKYKSTHNVLPSLAGAIDFIEASEDAGALQAARYIHQTIREKR